MKKLLYHSDVVTNIEKIISTLENSDSNNIRNLEKEKLIEFIRWFLIKRNKFLIYVGAGGSKDIDVINKENNFSEKAKTHGWQALLKEVYDQIDNKREFLKVASARVGALECLSSEKKGANFKDNKPKPKPKGVVIEDIKDDVWEEKIFKKYGHEILQEVLNKLGPLKFAWNLKWFVNGQNERESTEARDKILSSIVNKEINNNKDGNSKYYKKLEFESKLLEQVVKLPFREIITTNYDHYLEIFLSKHEKRRNFNPIHNTNTLVESLQTNKTRLYYLHGRADELDNLVLDKYDYAQLFAKNRHLLDHLVRLFLRYGILYVGFGLDDQTFDYMGSQMRLLCGQGKNESEISKYIPVSYAFMKNSHISQNEINALFELYNIQVIKFGDFPDIPLVLEKINGVLAYTEGRDVKWLEKDKQIDEVQELLELAVTTFLEGDLRESLEYNRKALAHTLFWTVETEDNGEKQWKKIQIICEIRRSLTLTRSKLRWTDDWNKTEETYHIEDNFESTEKILDDFEEEFKHFLTAGGNRQKLVKEALIVERVALNMLKARIHYQKGMFNKAGNEFVKFTLENRDNHDYLYKNALKIVKKVIRKAKIGKLKKHEIKLLETYYFAQCQHDRTFNIFSNDSDRRITERLVREIEKIHKKQWTFYKNDNYEYIKKEILALKEFGTIAVIAKWGLAFGKLRDFSSFINIESKSKRTKNLKSLKDIGDLLEQGWDYAKCIKSYDNDDDIKNEIKECLPSPRWETVKHRSMCRVLALIWFNDNSKADVLSNSYKSIQKALDLTSNKDALEIQHLRNLLEAVRLNVITNFVEVYVNEGNDSSMCFAASYHYLKSAFKILERVLKGKQKTTEQYVWWVLIQAYETGCFWRLVFEPFVEKILEDDMPDRLNKFINMPKSDIKNFVKSEYLEFGKKVLEDSTLVDGNIDSFREVFEEVVSKTKNTTV